MKRYARTDKKLRTKIILELKESLGDSLYSEFISNVLIEHGRAFDFLNLHALAILFLRAKSKKLDTGIT